MPNTPVNWWGVALNQLLKYQHSRLLRQNHQML